jgi:hypothetical protein
MVARACVFVLIGLSACLGSGDSQKATEAVRVRDSAGVQIVENDSPRWTDKGRLKLSDTPALVLGNDRDEQYLFSRVVGAARLSDESIVVANGGSAELRFFDSTGKFIRAVGRRGRGPGELVDLIKLYHLEGDTLLAGGGGGFGSYFTADGEFVTSLAHATLAERLGSDNPMIVGVFGDGTFLAAFDDGPPSNKGQRSTLDSIGLARVDRGLTKATSLGKHPYMYLYSTPNGLSTATFGAEASWAANGDRFYTGLGEAYAINVFRNDGTLERIIRRRWTPRRIGQADKDAFVAEWSKRWVRSTGAAAEEQIKVARQSAFAEVAPAFVRLVADRADNLWVREGHIEDAPSDGLMYGLPIVPSVWSVFDRDGVWLSDVTMPAGFRPLEIGGDYVLGLYRDDDGIETVRLYRLERGS